MTFDKALLVSRYNMSEEAAERLTAELSVIRESMTLPVDDALGKPATVARYVEARYAVPGQEVLGALFLDCRHRLLCDEVLFRGSIDRCVADPRPILRRALLATASGFVVFHTHPAGDPSPSLDDLAFTARLAEAAKTLGFQLLDHVIVGHGGRWLSLQQHGAPIGAWGKSTA